MERLLIQNLLVKILIIHVLFSKLVWSIKEKTVCKALTIGGMGGEGIRSIEIEDFSEHQAKVKFTGIAQDVFQKSMPPYIYNIGHIQSIFLLSVMFNYIRTKHGMYQFLEKFTC